jgi:hypothetical protein
MGRIVYDDIFKSLKNPYPRRLQGCGRMGSW